MPLGNTRYMQYVSAITGALTVATAALYFSWPSPILPKIASGDSPLGNVTSEQRSWIVASVALGHIPGALLSGWTLETVGRRGSMVLSGLPILIPWFVVAFSSSVWVVCVARFIAGAAIGNAVGALTLYNGEIAEKEIRGRIGSMFNILGITGDLIIYCVGPYVSYVSLSLICSTVPLIFVIVFYFMPESPYYLVKVGKDLEASKSLKRLLRNDTTEEEMDAQLNAIKRSIDAETVKETTLWEFLTNKIYRKLLILLLGIHSLHQLSGFAAIASYMQTIVQSGKGSVSPEVGSMICGLVQIPAVFLTAAIVDRAGRKPLLIISSLGCGLALFIEGLFFYLQDILKADVSSLSWIPVSGILFYLIMRPLGLGTLTFILIGELFPANVKGHVVTIGCFYNNFLSFIVAKIFEPVSNAFGMHVMFAIFTVFCVLGALFVYFILPETKGKSFSEIQQKINRQAKRISYDAVGKPS